MIAFTVKAAIVTALVCLALVVVYAIAARLFLAFLPAILLWNMRRKAGR